MAKNRWIQGAVDKRKAGALHRQLGISQDKVIPKGTLRDIVDTDVGKHSHGHIVTTLLKRRENVALNAQKRRR